MSDQRPIWVKAFVGRSFLQKDEAIWNEIRKMLANLRSIGVIFEDASEAQPRPISQKVRAGIDQSDLYVGILTQRFPIYPENAADKDGDVSERPPEKWGTSSWIVQESGYALGKNKRVILMLEEGVDFPKSDMDADQERIVFKRGEEIQCFGSLTSMIGNLIAERLPRSGEGETVAQVTSAPSTQSRQQNIVAQDAPTLRGAISLVDRGELEEADRQIAKILEGEKSEEDKIFLESMYLREKAVRGRPDALDALEKLAHESQHFFAWDQLADYYAAFNRFTEAADVLVRGADTVKREDRPLLIRLAAYQFANGQQFESAYQLLRNMLSAELSSEDKFGVFVGLADLAKEQKRFELETGALEEALLLNPSSADTRFRLAFLYADEDRADLALYHYLLRLRQGPSAASSNNLAIVFDKLDLPGKEIEMYRMAEELPLALANLSHVYLGRGFLSEAAELARKASKSSDTQTQSRAANAFQQIEDMRKNENQRKEKSITDSEPERTFRAKFARMFLSSETAKLNGRFKTPFGDLSFEQNGPVVTGVARVEEDLPKNSFGSLMIGPADLTMRIKTLHFEAVLQGLTGRFTFEVRGVPLSSLLTSELSKAKGLIIVDAAASSIEILDESRHPCTVSVARKIEGASSEQS